MNRRSIRGNAGHFVNLDRLSLRNISGNDYRLAALVYKFGKHCNSGICALETVLLNVESLHLLLTGNAQTENLLYNKECKRYCNRSPCSR